VSGAAPIEPDAAPPSALATWEVREASLADVPAVAAAVGDLLVELGGTPASASALEGAARTLVEDRDAGALLVADADTLKGTPSGAPPMTGGGQAGGELVGVLGASWQHAVRVPGRYGLIQELWVHPAWRGRTIGGDLVVALLDLARARDVARVEVGLPGERFPHLAATEAFYLNNGFATIGSRMRRML
jgi:GNAT superfamily N-acetyltransferase